MRLLPIPDYLQGKPVFGVSEDFNHYTTAEDFTTTVSDSGTVAHGDAVGGVVTLTPSDGTVADNDEAYMHGTSEVFKWATDKPMFCEACVKFTEANTDDANIAVGYKDAVAANSILDDGGGPAASYHGACFFKVDGGTKWQVETSMGATQTTNTTTITAGAAYQTLRIETRIDGSDVVNTFFIDGAQCIDNTTGLPIKHRVAIASATEMEAFTGVKNGGANLETLLVDYYTCLQLR